MKKILPILALSCLPLSSHAAQLDTEQQDQVRQLIHQTLVENPDIIVEAIEVLRTQEFENQQRQKQAALSHHKTDLFNDSADPYIGAKKPELTIAYFTDYNCAFCKRQDPLLDKIIKDFPQVRIVYKDLPILGESSREAAVMALMAFKNNPESYIALHNKLMSKPGKHNTQSIEAAIKSSGIDLDKLKKGKTQEANQQLDQNLQLATDLGIQGTPALVFPDAVLGGYTDLQKIEGMIKERLKHS